MILFPTAIPVFAGLEADGMAIFYVSCIISQLVYSLGGSMFKGGIGSELVRLYGHLVNHLLINLADRSRPLLSSNGIHNPSSSWRG